MSTIADVVQKYEQIRQEQEEFYRDLHQHPELSHQEERTAAEVAKRLTGWGFEVQTGIGGTGVTGVMHNGDGATVLMRADMDALPVQEKTGADYASSVQVTDAEGRTTPVMHACGHDVHVSCLLGASRLLSQNLDAWQGTAVVLFQPAEEAGDGARRMLDDGLADVIPHPDVALSQHVLVGESGTANTRVGPVFSSADSVRITVHGRGGHGSMPQNTIDPVILAAFIAVRLQTIVSRELPPSEPAVLTVGSIRAGTKSNIVPDDAILELNIRTYTPQTREHMLEAIERIAEAECAASGVEKTPDIEVYDSFPLTTNDETATTKVADAFGEHFGDRAGELALQTASEDFSDLPNALGVPYSYWGIGGTDAELLRTAVESGSVESDIPSNHSPKFLPVMQPTLQTGTEALLVAAGAWLGIAKE